MTKLVIRAGSEAYKRIKEEGFTSEMVSGVVAAAGGPKWFTTYGLMKYVISDLLINNKNHLHFLGSSVGSWQMAAAVTSDPKSSIERLQKAYCTTIYSDQPDEHEISQACKSFIEYALKDEIDHVLDSKARSLHIIATRGKGILSHSNKLVRGLGFGGTFILNMMDRKLLSIGGERVIFSNQDELPFNHSEDTLRTKKVRLTKQNIIPSLRASGSIPFVMKGVADIDDAPSGMYWDGGLTDYHISLPYNLEGLVIHPHFLPDVLLGWFDKRLPLKRKAKSSAMSKVILITPSREYVNSLPRRQISDMKDFYHFGEDQEARIQYWSEISERSLELGAELKQIIDSNSLDSIVQRY